MNFAKTIAVARHRLRYGRQMIHPPSYAVCGAYHYENVGDMALAAVGKKYMADVQPAMQTTANIAKWPGSPRSLICGGAVVTNDLLDQCRFRFKDDPSKLAMIGVEISDIGGPITKENRNFINNISYLSLRNTRQLDLISDAHGNTIARTMPDIAFTFPQVESVLQEERLPVLGVNVTAGLSKPNNVSNSELNAIRHARNLFFRLTVEIGLQSGLKVVNIPFAISDDGQARSILEGLPVEYEKYTSNPHKVIKKVARCNSFVSSRFHAFIFSLVTHTPVTPFLYAKKNQWLAKDMLNKDDMFGFESLGGIPSKSQLQKYAEEKLTIPSEKISLFRENIDAEFCKAITALRVQNRSNL